MKRKYIGIIGFCLTVCLMGILPFITAGCSSTKTTESAPTLVSLAITPKVINHSTGNNTILAVPVVLTKGDPTASFVAIGTYSDGAAMDITDLCDWTSTNPNVATVAYTRSGGVVISGSGGTTPAAIVTVGPGTTSITATLFGKTSNAVSLQVQ
jgi:hypothetical protein